MTAELGRLEAVNPRDVWPNEAQYFTPWLLAHADVLSEAVSMDLELEAAELAVGEFSLDLIGNDASNGEKVIVENQLEVSDHRHLGQILTYAGGTDTANVIWIATSFREEHRAALEWLNERTDEHTRFFAVQLDLVRIGESAPAPLLTLVVRPNDWGKQVRSSASTTRSWNEEDFFRELSNVASTELVDAAKSLYEQTRSAVPDAYFYWGGGRLPAMTAQIPAGQTRLQPWTLYLEGAPSGGPVLAINFEWIYKNGRGADEAAMEAFAQQLRQLPEIEPYVASARVAGWRRRPSIPANQLFGDQDALPSLVAALDVLYQAVRPERATYRVE